MLDPKTEKPILLSEHAQDQLAYRGIGLEEIEQAIREGIWIPAKYGKLECSKDFEYNKEWNKKWYRTKRVRPIFMEEPKAIIVVTVFSYYF